MCFQTVNDLAEYVKAGGPSRDMPTGSPEWQAKQKEASQQQGGTSAAPRAPGDGSAASQTSSGPSPDLGSSVDRTGFSSLAIPRTNLPGASKNVTSG